MRVSYDWLKTMIDIPEDPKTLSDEYIRTGTEVEAIDTVGESFDHVVTAQVLTKTPHPDSDHMYVCSVDVGDKNLDADGNPAPLQIVCGAQNFEAGDHIVTAMIGAVLPGDVKIKKSKLRGVVSMGMNCSARELGLGGDHSGIMILPEDTPCGMPFAEYVGSSDTVLDCEITPNRPDCLSMIGMARETGAIFDRDFHVELPAIKAETGQGMCAAGDFLPLLVLGGEDDFTPFIRDTFAQPVGIDVMLAGVSDDDEVRAHDVRVDDEGRPVFTLDFGQGETIDTMLAIPGVQSVPNAVKAAAVAYRLGVTPEQIDTAFRGLMITGHRQEIKRAKSGARVIDDSYNASAESMAAGLDLLCSLSCTGSRMAILGEMGEMGDDAPRMHELVGAYAAAKKLDMLACVGGELAQLMADAARMMGMDEDRIQVFSDYQQVLDRMGGALEKHDVVLVKGSRFVELDRFVEGVC